MTAEERTEREVAGRADLPAIGGFVWLRWLGQWVRAEVLAHRDGGMLDLLGPDGSWQPAVGRGSHGWLPAPRTANERPS